jgi:hypothetical protein
VTRQLPPNIGDHWVERSDIGVITSDRKVEWSDDIVHYTLALKNIYTSSYDAVPSPTMVSVQTCVVSTGCTTAGKK